MSVTLEIPDAVVGAMRLPPPEVEELRKAHSFHISDALVKAVPAAAGEP